MRPPYCVTLFPTVTGVCCPPGSINDASGACCAAGVLDACGVCNGTGVAVDIRGIEYYIEAVRCREAEGCVCVWLVCVCERKYPARERCRVVYLYLSGYS